MPQLSRRSRRSKRSKRLSVIGTMLAILLLVAFVGFPLFSGLVAPLVPRSVENAVGAEMIKDTAAKGSFCSAPEGVAALETLVRRLAAQAPDESFEVYVSDQEILNAFAAPGGRVVLFAPIIAQADSPEEVAGVLAHEMGHVVEGDPAEGLVEAVGYGIFGMLTPGGGREKEVAQALLTSRHSRADELDADLAGVELLNGAGIDSRGLFQFFDRLKAAGDEVPGAVDFLATHPSERARKENLEEVAEAGDAALTEVQWKALRAICDETGAPDPIVVVGE